ncbi:ParA family protein [Mariprofundus erugo]|uniref:ParA family protein n=1 Tax=Mariprofundus erugo TaxID=2528639 RepID=A0A5R9GTX1_9PROT|nr:ParA family protein [Mariprofundus erugo]TLS74825.1 ParA family protein [Mariprofundus erugo]
MQNNSADYLYSRKKPAKIIAVYNIKGGVGKTSTAVNLAWLASRHDGQVLLWDLDPQGAAAYCLQAKAGKRSDQLLKGKLAADKAITRTAYEHLDLLRADFSLRHADLLLSDMKKPEEQLSRVIAPMIKSYDFIIIDSPPGLTLLSEAIFKVADLVVFPTLPSILSLRMLAELLDFKKEHHLKQLHIRAFLNMVDSRKSLHRQIIAERHRMGKVMLNSQIPYASAVEQMAERRMPLPCFDPHSPAALAYGILWAEVFDALQAIKKKGS